MLLELSNLQDPKDGKNKKGPRNQAQSGAAAAPVSAAKHQVLEAFTPPWKRLPTTTTTFVFLTAAAFSKLLHTEKDADLMPHQALTSASQGLFPGRFIVICPVLIAYATSKTTT